MLVQEAMRLRGSQQLEVSVGDEGLLRESGGRSCCGVTDKRERSKLTRLACCTTTWSNEQCRESMEGVHGSFMLQLLMETG